MAYEIVASKKKCTNLVSQGLAVEERTEGEGEAGEIEVKPSSAVGGGGGHHQTEVSSIFVSPGFRLKTEGLQRGPTEEGSVKFSRIQWRRFG